MKLNRKGFTLIELLAVITILGILMIVGIPAVQRTINNSRKDTFLDTAKEYANAVKTAWAADELSCTKGSDTVRATGAGAGNYYVWVSTGAVSGITAGAGATDNKDRLIQSGGKSSWGSNDITGYVRVYLASATANPVYYVYIADSKQHGIKADVDKPSDQLERADVGDTVTSLPELQSDPWVCTVEAA